MILKGILALVVCLAVAGVAVGEKGMGYSKPKWVAGSCHINSADVSWDAVGEANLSGYNIYEKPLGAPEYTKANLEPIIATQFTVQGLSSGLTYAFGVTAIYDGGGESEMSGPALCTTG